MYIYGSVENVNVYNHAQLSGADLGFEEMTYLFVTFCQIANLISYQCKYWDFETKQVDSSSEITHKQNIMLTYQSGNSGSWFD